MNNIFENAYFGKSYKTRDGRKAIYHLKEKENNEHILIFDNWYAFIRYKSNGKYLGENSDIDIISEWHEPIDEEKLDKLAEEYENEIYGYSVDLEDDIETDCSNLQNIIDIHETFKAAYRKGMEEKS